MYDLSLWIYTGQNAVDEVKCLKRWSPKQRRSLAWNYRNCLHFHLQVLYIYIYYCYISIYAPEVLYFSFFASILSSTVHSQAGLPFTEEQKITMANDVMENVFGTCQPCMLMTYRQWRERQRPPIAKWQVSGPCFFSLFFFPPPHPFSFPPTGPINANSSAGVLLNIPMPGLLVHTTHIFMGWSLPLLTSFEWECSCPRGRQRCTCM